MPTSRHLSRDLNDEGASRVDMWGTNVPDKVFAETPRRKKTWSVPGSARRPGWLEQRARGKEMRSAAGPEPDLSVAASRAALASPDCGSNPDL